MISSRLYTTLLTVCLFVFWLTAFAEEGPALPPASIRGVVQTSDGKPAAFVSISVKDSNTGTVSNEDGNLSLWLPSGNYVLVVSFVGLQPQEKVVTVAAGKTLDVQLRLIETARQLNAVQVRGFRSANQKPVITGKVAIRPLDLPHVVAIVEREVLERQQALRLSDVLMNTNGVYVMGTTRGGAGRAGRTRFFVQQQQYLQKRRSV